MSVIAIMRGVSDEASLFTEGDVVSITLVCSAQWIQIQIQGSFHRTPYSIEHDLYQIRSISML